MSRSLNLTGEARLGDDPIAPGLEPVDEGGKARIAALLIERPAVGVEPAQLRDFAEKAVAIKRILRVNPRPATADDCEAIYRSAL